MREHIDKAYSTIIGSEHLDKILGITDYVIKLYLQQSQGKQKLTRVNIKTDSVDIVKNITIIVQLASNEETDPIVNLNLSFENAVKYDFEDSEDQPKKLKEALSADFKTFEILKKSVEEGNQKEGNQEEEEDIKKWEAMQEKLELDVKTGDELMNVEPIKSKLKSRFFDPGKKTAPPRTLKDIFSTFQYFVKKLKDADNERRKKAAPPVAAPAAEPKDNAEE
jgi:hypothetical protein